MESKEQKRIREVNEYRAYKWALSEMRSMTDHPCFIRLKEDPRCAASLRNNPARWIWTSIVSTDAHPSTDVANALSNHAANVYSIIKNVRRSMQARATYAPLISFAEETVVKATHIFRSFEVRGGPAIVVSCASRGGYVDKSRSRDLIVLPLLWLKKVHDEGIAAVDHPSGKVCCTVWASRKKSSFLEAEGIAVYDAKVYVSAKTSSVEDGYIFSSDGGKFSIFHTDFRLGSNLIRRRIRSSVLAMLMGEQ